MRNARQFPPLVTFGVPALIFMGVLGFGFAVDHPALMGFMGAVIGGVVLWLMS